MLRIGALALAVGVSSAALAVAPSDTEGDIRVICQNAVRTGSTMVKGKTCRLAAAWNKSYGALRDDEDFSNEPPITIDRKLREGEVLQTGSANWDKMPDIKVRMTHVPYWQLVAITEEVLRTKQCSLDGQSAKSFDITVPYAALVEPNGKTSRVLVSGVGCPQIETLVGITVLSLSDRGEIKSTGEPKARWYDGRLNLTLKGG